MSTAEQLGHPDLLRIIISFCDKDTLATLSRVDSTANTLATPKLYRHITIAERNGHMAPLPTPIHKYIDLPCSSGKLQENDHQAISHRLSNSLKHTRTLSIGSHPRQADVHAYSHGLPLSFMECLNQVHTVRLLTPAHTSGALHMDVSPRFCALFGQCGGQTWPCSLAFIRELSPRSIIVSGYIPAVNFLPFQSATEGSALSTTALHRPHLVITVDSALCEIAWMEDLRNDFSSGYEWTVVCCARPLSVTIDDRDIKSNLLRLFRINTYSLHCKALRIAFHAEICDQARRVLDTIKRSVEVGLHEYRVNGDTSNAYHWQYLEKILPTSGFSIVTIDSIMNEEWVQAFEGTKVEDWGK